MHKTAADEGQALGMLLSHDPWKILHLDRAASIAPHTGHDLQAPCIVPCCNDEPPSEGCECTTPPYTLRMTEGPGQVLLGRP